jgi:hypothetical protein
MCIRDSHTGYFGDISVGDIWSLEMKANPIKHNAIIIRTTEGESAFSNALAAGHLHVNTQPIEAICQGQARSLRTHHNISARSRVAPLFKEKIKDPLGNKVALNELLIAFIILFNHKLSQKQWGKKIIMKLPRFFIRAYLYFLKGLESL